MNSKPTYSIIICDDHTILREGLKKLISKDPNLEVVAEATDGEELLTMLKTTPCNLLLLDISMGKLNGFEVLKKIRNQYQDLHILILTTHKQIEYLKKAFSLGAVGYLTKDDAFEQLLDAIKTVQKGDKYVSPTMSMLLTDKYTSITSDDNLPNIELLTPTEKSILKQIAKGSSNSEIATANDISIRTVETHRSRILKKTKAKNMLDLIRVIYTYKLLEV